MKKVLSLNTLFVEHDYLKRKVDDLNTCLLKLTKCKGKFDKLFKTQRMPFENNGLGYTCNHKHTHYTSYFIKVTSSNTPNVCCTYSDKNGYFMNKCYVKRKIERGVKTL